MATVVHVAGPWEETIDEDGSPWDVQRCLRCDAVLVERMGTLGVESERGYHLGALVGMKGKLHIFEIRRASLNADERPCQGGGQEHGATQTPTAAAAGSSFDR